MSQNTIERELEKLSTAERLELIGRIWDSLPDTNQPLPMPDWHRQELDRRIAEADATPEAGLLWEDIRESLRDEE